MTDYYPLIVRAIAGLDANAPGESRRALYERARAALIAQLRSVQPTLSESETTRERLALDEAIRRVEGEIGQNPLEEELQQIEALNERDPLAELARIIGQTDPFGATHSRFPVVSEANDELAAGPPRWLQRAGAWNNSPETAEASSDPDPGPRREDQETYGRPPTPPISVIPEQDLSTAIGFSPTRKGPLDLVLDPPTDPHDKEQSELYTRIRRQLKKLKDEIPSQERSQVNDAIDDFLENHPDDWDRVEYKKLVWLSGNSLRALLAQHDSIKNDPEHYSKLPPSVAEALRNPVQAWSVFVQGDPELALLDYYSLGPQEQQRVRENLKAVGEVVSRASQDRRIMTERAANAVDSTMKSASVDSMDVSTKLAQEMADKTSRNLVSQILRKAYLVHEAIVNPVSDEAKALRADMKKNASYAAGGAMASVALAASHHALPFLEFIATNPILVKQYVVTAFQNVPMGEIVDAIEFEYNRLKGFG
jgi:hypothetical protein